MFMKKITVHIPNMNSGNAKQIGESIDALSGVVAADASVAEGRIFAYAGDKLPQQAIISAMQSAGYHGSIEKEEYFDDMSDARRAMNETM